MIQDRHFVYPHELAHDEVCARVLAVLKRSKNFDVLADPRLGLDHFIWRTCLEYDLNPAWPLLSMQRERSLLGVKADDVHDYLFALGYVGQDGAGTKNERWNGLAVQLWLCIHQTAWIAGFGLGAAYGVQLNLRPTARRWDSRFPSKIQLYTAPNVRGDLYLPKSLSEHVVLTYTPHAEALPRAGELLHQFVPEFE